MTELLTTTRLREIAHVTEHPHMYLGTPDPQIDLDSRHSNRTTDRPLDNE